METKKKRHNTLDKILIRIMRTIFFSAFAAAFCFLSCQDKPVPKMTGLAGSLQDSTIIRVWAKEVDSLWRIDPNIPIVDVRSEQQFRICHIFRAMNCDVNAPDFAQRILRLSVQSPVIVYDLDSSLSLKAAEKMKELGFKRIYELAGGVYGWSSAGKTLVSGGSKIDSSAILK